MNNRCNLGSHGRWAFSEFTDVFDVAAGPHVLDMGNRRWRGVFEPLQDVALFRQFRLERELNTIAWPTGTDLAPEYLYEQASHNPVAGMEEQRRQGSADELPDRANDTRLAVAVGGSPAPSDAER